MTPHRKTCPHVVHFKVPRVWFQTNSRHQKHYSEGGKKIRGCRGLLGRVIPYAGFAERGNASQTGAYLLVMQKLVESASREKSASGFSF